VGSHQDGDLPLENARGSPIGSNSHLGMVICLFNCQLVTINLVTRVAKGRQAQLGFTLSMDDSLDSNSMLAIFWTCICTSSSMIDSDL
jgi:hypothetical protein